MEVLAKHAKTQTVRRLFVTGNRAATVTGMPHLAHPIPLNRPHAIPHPQRLGAYVFWPQFEPDFAVTAEIAVIDGETRVLSIAIESRTDEEVQSTHLRQISLPQIRSFLKQREQDLGSPQIDAQAFAVDYLDLLNDDEVSSLPAPTFENPSDLGEWLSVAAALSEERRHEIKQQAARASGRLSKAKPHRGRGVEIPQEFYRDIALMYLKHYAEFGNRVIKKMTESLHAISSFENVPDNTVRHWVWRARKQGWLTKGEQGKAGGRPGPLLVEWLESSRRDES